MSPLMVILSGLVVAIIFLPAASIMLYARANHFAHREFHAEAAKTRQIAAVLMDLTFIGWVGLAAFGLLLILA